MLPVGTTSWWFCNRRDCRGRERLPATERARLRLWIASFATDAFRMSSMRALVARESMRDVSGLSNEAVVDAVCALVATDTVHIHCDVQRPAPAKSIPKGDTAAPAPVVAPRPAPKTFVKAPTVAPPAFDIGVDLSRQATALVAAAAEGAPFCPI